MKRILLAWGVLFAAVVAGAAPSVGEVEQRLAAIKREFPAHTAGAISEQSDPEVALCYFEFKRDVLALSAGNLIDGFEVLRTRLVSEISYAESYNNFSSRNISASVAKNLTWMKTRLRPYLKRIEGLTEAN